MNILVLLAIVGIGFLLYRSLVIKRESEGEPPTADTSSTEELPQTATLPPTVTPSEDKNNAVKQADITSEVGQSAERKAVAAQAKAVEKAHQQRAHDAVQNDLDGPPSITPEAPAEPPLAEPPLAEPPLKGADDGPAALSVPDQLATPVGALQETKDPLARHRLYQQIVDISYRRRGDESYRQALLYFAPAHIQEFPSIAPLLKAQNGGNLPQVTSFKHYASALTEAEKYSEAVVVCEQAQQYDLKDGTKSGYAGRVERINKLKARAAAS